MIETQNNEINVDELMAKIRREIANRHKTDRSKSGSYSLLRNKDVVNWMDIALNLKTAEENTDVGLKQLPLLRFPRSIRWLAKLVEKLLLYVTQVVTIPQRHYNRAILDTLNSLLEATRVAYEKVDNYTGLIEELNTSNSELRTQLNHQDRRLSFFLEEANKRLPEPFDQNQIQKFADEKHFINESLYLFFEDHFRGSRQDIQKKMAYYIPYLEKADAGNAETIIVDAGCGRGEWLELLNQKNLKAIGIDVNKTLVQQCLKLNLNVVQSDIIEYLRSLPDESIGAVTAFHLIEHLPFETLIKFMDESLRVLKSGGIVIFETPNPQNFSVGACNFYLDPTHRNPLPAETVKFLVKSRGFLRVTTEPLHPIRKEDQIQDDGSEIVRRFNQLFYGPQDYALIGYKS
jgi:O-antigen chain-terminating methyltransferase